MLSLSIVILSEACANNNAQKTNWALMADIVKEKDEGGMLPLRQGFVGQVKADFVGESVIVFCSF